MQEKNQLKFLFIPGLFIPGFLFFLYGWAPPTCT